MAKNWVYAFNEVEAAEKSVGGNWDDVRSLLGGKGANLADMTRLGIPVPPGFIITTEACNAYQQNDQQFPAGMWDQVLANIQRVEAAAGRVFGGASNPLLVSCRSGAKFSMPGMMDTVLNIGLNDETVQGMIARTGDERVVYDLYRRLLQMFGCVVLNIADEPFEDLIEVQKKKRKVKLDVELKAEDWKELCALFKDLVEKEYGAAFPQDPYQQLKMAAEAVFKSWNGKRAVDYRNAAGISHALGTAVNVQTMVFGNMGDNSGTGVAFTRDPATGERKLYGDYLINAQGEDVVAGIRNTKPIAEMEKEFPGPYSEFIGICAKLEKHYKDLQDVEFTIEQGKLWMLQTRSGKRTAKAAVRAATEMVDEGLITREEAVRRVSPDQVDILLHPQFEPSAEAQARENGQLFAHGVNASPGAAVGRVYFDATKAEHMAKDEHQDVIMVRPFTRPDDVHGMLAAKGILTSEGGATSHAAVVARQFGVPCVVGASSLKIDLETRRMRVNGIQILEGDWISVDGTNGDVFIGNLPTVAPKLEEQVELLKLLGWADEIALKGNGKGRGLQVWANADYPADAQRARSYGARGIGLCRTEHMFFEQVRLPIVQRMILSEVVAERRAALDELLPYQQSDFEGLFRAMDGLPVIIRLIDPPLHEFLPNLETLIEEVATLRALDKRDGLNEKEQLLGRVRAMHESNPMMGMRGVRLSIVMPEIVEMQVRAIFQAAVAVSKEGIKPKPEVMIPLAGHINELKFIQPRLEVVAQKVMKSSGLTIEYKFGTMIEIPRAALTAGEIAQVAEFFSFGTNDLTQMTYGFSRDDAEGNFLLQYVEEGILPNNPFQTVDQAGVGRLMAMAVDEGRRTRPDLEVGICGEHGGDPASIEFCQRIGLNYVSCSPFRVPIARLAAAQATLKSMVSPNGKVKH
ncbi:MAG: pyruvate, phosphate dikinase [Anaerolineales bacterium]